MNRTHFTILLLFLSAVSAVNFTSCGQKSNKKESSDEVAVNPEDSVKKVDSVFSADDVEYYELKWQSDYTLCDTYEFSEGDLILTVYRLKKSKKIVFLEEQGNFCQGDSDFRREYHLNREGEAIYSDDVGIYSPSITIYYKNGIPDLEVTSPGEEEEEGEYRHLNINPNHEEPLLSENMERLFEGYLLRRKNRLAALKKMTFTAEQKEEKSEAQFLISNLENSIKSEPGWKDGFVLRKPRFYKRNESGEHVVLNTKTVNLYEKPWAKSKVIYTFDNYGDEEEFLEVLDGAIIEPKSRNENTDWTKIKFIDPKTKKVWEGWIDTDFIAEDVFWK